MSPAPIVLFVYNRPADTQRAVASLQMNVLAAESELFIYSDGPSHASHAVAVEQVRHFLNTITGFKNVTVVKSGRNLGAASNIIKGITEIVKRYDKVIVLQDNLVVLPGFLQFMNDGLNKYEHNEEVIAINGYNIPMKFSGPVYFLRGGDYQGWATWARGWKLFNTDGEYQLRELKLRKLLYDFDMDGNYPFTEMLEKQNQGKVNSWKIRWLAASYLHNKLTLHPVHSLVQPGGEVKHIVIPDVRIEESKLARKLVGKQLYTSLSAKSKLRKMLRSAKKIFLRSNK